MCTIVYRADDGKEFDNMEDCKKYNDQPSIWLVKEQYNSGHWHTCAKYLKAFESKILADDFIRYHKDVKRNDNKYEYTVERYTISDGGKYND